MGMKKERKVVKLPIIDCGRLSVLSSLNETVLFNTIVNVEWG